VRLSVADPSELRSIRSSIVLGVALAVGAGVLLTIRGALGPGVRAFGVILASIEVRKSVLSPLTLSSPS